MDFADVALEDIDARIVTAISLWVIGCIVIGFVAKIWWTPLLRRPFLLGPYFTQRGQEAILNGLPTLCSLGLLAIAGGTSRFIYWLHGRQMASDGAAALSGLAEAVIALWVAGILSLFAARTWLNWKRGGVQ